jgi:hypothetical protein
VTQLLSTAPGVIATFVRMFKLSMLKNNHIFSTSFPKLNLIETSKFCSIGQKSVNLPDTKTILKKYEKILIEKKKN